MSSSLVVCGLVGFAGCGSEPATAASPVDAGGGAPVFDVGAPPPVRAADAAADAESDAGAWPTTDSGFVVEDAGTIRGDRFATRVVSFTPGGCAGFGSAQLPGVVLGPPVGGGTSQGGLHVASLGHRGEIVLSMEPNAILDGPGVDFLVFENSFYLAGNPQTPFAELAEVSVSDDGATWKTFPCTRTTYPYGACAGWHPTVSAPGNGVSPVDPAAAGGDPFDLHDVGLVRARFVRIKDLGTEPCPDGGSEFRNNGFDLDAISVVNAETP